MLQKDLTCYYENPGPTPLLVNTDGSLEELQLTKFSPTYLCMIVFRAALEPLSSFELVAFSNSITKFQTLDCQVVGVARDSPMVLQEWLVEEKAKFPCISCLNLGPADFGLIQSIGVPLDKGYPIPSIIITDKKDKVRYFASFNSSTGRSVEETLRVVAAIRMVDNARGSQLAPADWVSPQPTISNTKAGVLKYYEEKYKEEKQKKVTETQPGLLAALWKKVGSIYAMLFGVASSLNPAIKDSDRDMNSTQVLLVDSVIQDQEEDEAFCEVPSNKEKNGKNSKFNRRETICFSDQDEKETVDFEDALEKATTMATTGGNAGDGKK